MLLSNKIKLLLNFESWHHIRRNTRWNLEKKFLKKYIITTVAFVEADISFTIIPIRTHFIKKLRIFINLFTVFSNVTVIGSILRFPLSEYYFDGRGLCSVPKVGSNHTGYQTATYHGSSRAGRWTSSCNCKI